MKKQIILLTLLFICIPAMSSRYTSNGSNNALHFCVAPGEESSCEGGEVQVFKEVNVVTIYT